MIALLIIVLVLLFASMVAFGLYLKHSGLIRGWTVEVTPRGTSYEAVVKDPDGEQWGWTGSYDSKFPMSHTAGARYRGSYNRYHDAWPLNNPRWARSKVVKCAKQKRRNEKVDARTSQVKKF